MMKTIRKGQGLSLDRHITRHNILGLVLCITIMCVISDLALSVRTYYDNVAFASLLISFAFCIVIDLIKDKSAVLKRIKDIFYSAKWLYIALIAYYLWDIITMLYTKNISHALNKLPYMLEYTSIFLIGLYYCSTQKRLFSVMSSVALTGTIVSILTYIYYFSSRNPIYYQRLSTARDYNVYACLIFICFVFATDLIINYSKLSFLKRIIIFTIISAINIPTFYLSGSRRMFIMLPFFFAFAVLYEGIRLIISRKKSISVLPRNLAFFVIAVVIYFGAVSCLGAFSKIGLQKEADYKDYIKQQELEGKEIIIKPPSYNEKTISSVLETIENKTMYNKRSLIYSVAFKELKEYTPLEFIFGKGAAYDIHMFDVTTDEALLKAYSIDEKNPRPSGWLSAHSFALADVLNGGIIKLLLAIFLIFQIARHIIIAVKQKKRAGLILVIPFALVIANNFISGAYGMLNDVFFQVMMLILCGMLYINKKEHLDETK